jgi:dTMP kinase
MIGQLAGPIAAPGAHGLPGLLIVLEGTDRVGRSTHIRLVEQHLRYGGRAVTRTSMATSAVAGRSVRRARAEAAGPRPDPVATVLLDAADLAERIEQVILPALKAGLIVLADRYAYTPMARAETRSVDPEWLDRLFAFAPPPDATFLLEIDARTALARADGRPTNPYEAGLDLHLSSDALRSFRLFQERLHRCFGRYAPRYNFTSIDARDEASAVQARLKPQVDDLIASRAAPRIVWESAGPS